MTIRLHPPGNGDTRTINGRTYTGIAGTPQDIVFDDDARILMANGWTKLGEQSGPTAARPARPYVTQPFFDQTLGYVIHWDGKNWRGPTGSAV